MQTAYYLRFLVVGHEDELQPEVVQARHQAGQGGPVASRAALDPLLAEGPLWGAGGAGRAPLAEVVEAAGAVAARAARRHALGAARRARLRVHRQAAQQQPCDREG